MSDKYFKLKYVQHMKFYQIILEQSVLRNYTYNVGRINNGEASSTFIKLYRGVLAGMGVYKFTGTVRGNISIKKN